MGSYDGWITGSDKFNRFIGVFPIEGDMLSLSGDDRPCAWGSVCVIFVLLISVSGGSAASCFASIVSFGDSLADTGNLLYLSRTYNVKPHCSVYPYGETFFHRSTGRCSDGRLVVDFVAESLGLPFIEPYLGGENANSSGRSFANGVNFAVGGATALDRRFLANRGIYNVETDTSLGVQLDWFRKFLLTLPDGRSFVQRSLILLGEIGGNDYNFPLQLGMNISVLQDLTPGIISQIGRALEELVKLGGEMILVPGNIPMGCAPVYLTLYRTDNTTAYDPETGCLSWLNELSRRHNELLQRELIRLRELHPHVLIIYADYYNAAMRFYLSPQEFGFGTGVLRACCGAGEPYNYNHTALCDGFHGATLCEDPSTYASWDGLHFTEAAYRLIAKGLLEGPFTIPPVDRACFSPFQNAGSFET